MRNKLIIFNGIIIIVCAVVMLIANKQTTDYSLFFVKTITLPVGIVVAACLIVSYFLGVIGAVFSSKDIKSLEGENVKLSNKIGDLEAKLKQAKKEYAFQEKKVFFLENTIKEETEVKAPPPKPPPPKHKWIFRWPLVRILVKK